MSNFFVINLWDSAQEIENKINKILFACYKLQKLRVLIDSQYESYTYFTENNYLFQKLLGVLNNNNIKPYLLTSSLVNEPDPRINYIFFQEAFFKFGLQHLFIPFDKTTTYQKLNKHLHDTTALVWYNKQDKIIYDIDKLSYKYHFINLNCRAHLHRKILIDNLAKNQLIENNAVTWLNVDSPYADKEYQYQYFNKSILRLSENFSHFIDSGIKPVEYYESFCELVSESSYKDFWITEKTVSPLIIGKPFLTLGSVNFHKNLQKMGFALYDEIFNYDFDMEHDLSKRTEMLVENFVGLKKCPVSNLKSYNFKVKEKVLHNQNLAKQIAFDDDSYPDILKEIIELYFSKNINLNPVFINFYLNLKSLRNKFAK